MSCGKRMTFAGDDIRCARISNEHDWHVGWCADGLAVSWLFFDKSGHLADKQLVYELLRDNDLYTFEQWMGSEMERINDALTDTPKPTPGRDYTNELRRLQEHLNNTYITGVDNITRVHGDAVSWYDADPNAEVDWARRTDFKKRKPKARTPATDFVDGMRDDMLATHAVHDPNLATGWFQRLLSDGIRATCESATAMRQAEQLQSATFAGVIRRWKADLPKRNRRDATRCTVTCTQAVHNPQPNQYNASPSDLPEPDAAPNISYRTIRCSGRAGHDGHHHARVADNGTSYRWPNARSAQS